MHMIDADSVRTLLPMADCIDAMETAMTAASSGTVSMPPRTIMPLIDNSAYFGVMPGSLAEPRVYGAKIVGLHPANPAAGRPAIQGFVVLFDHDTGRPLAMVDGAAITALRTGAASGLATRLLARADAATLGLFGSGVQASAHLDAIGAVRDIREVRVWTRSPDRARAFADAHRDRVAARIVPCAAREAAADCDIICTVTGAGAPVLHGAWLRPGTHVNLVGAHSAATRETDTALIVRGKIYADALDALWNEAGDVLIPIGEGAIDRSHVIGEIGQLLQGTIPGRTRPEDITIYKSLGLVAQDLVAAHAVYRRATA
jgi:ornithine cyclodeaminase/alanine dehydrogenase-like protein (mu-crystallin family)